eukprot:UN27363
MDDVLKIHEVINTVSLMTFLGLIEDKSQIRADRVRMHVDQFIKDTKTGDIVLFKTEGILSRGLRGLTNSEFDHVAVVIKTNHEPRLRPKAFLLEATTDGVVRYDCWQRLQQWNMVNAKVSIKFD